MLYDWIKNIDFAYPENFMLLGLVPILIWWYVKRYDRKQPVMKVSAVGAFKVKTAKNYFRHLPFILRMLAVVALIVAVARPQKRNDQTQTQGEGIDIILCIDVSGSMGSRDILPSRMDVAKDVATDFVLSRPVDRIGLVIFSGESFSQVPLTTDRNTLVSQIQSLESRRYLKDGTVIGEGLATAVDRLSKSTAKSKVIILLTDGKEEAPETRLIDPLTALEITKTQRVKVYTIGMSAQNAIPLEENVKGRKPATTNNFLDEELLRRIASETDGEYFRARDKLSLQSIYGQIDKMEKSKIEIQSLRHYHDEFIPLLLIALGLLFIELTLRFTIFRKFP